MELKDYSELSGMGFEAKEQVSPEDEFFHSIYIAGQTRKNHIQVVEQAGKLQIRGVDYNLDNIFGIISHVKEVLVKSVQKQGKESTECFSFRVGEPPWKSSTGRLCGKNAAERASVDFCTDCRSQIIVSLIRCKQDGSLFLGADNKPVFMFLRGKGTKYSNVSTYLNDLSKLDLEPVFTPVTPETTRFEKSSVNHKRFITKISIGNVSTKFGNKAVYEFEKVTEIPIKQIPALLKFSKSTMTNFSEKFDWSKKSSAVNAQTTQASTSENSFSDLGSNKKEESATKVNENSGATNYDFDSINF